MSTLRTTAEAVELLNNAVQDFLNGDIDRDALAAAQRRFVGFWGTE